MPNPEIIKQIIDSGAYAAGTVLCVNGTVPWKLGEGVEPDPRLARKYIAAAKKLEEAGEALVAQITTGDLPPDVDVE